VFDAASTNIRHRCGRTSSSILASTNIQHRCGMTLSLIFSRTCYSLIASHSPHYPRRERACGKGVMARAGGGARRVRALVAAFVLLVLLDVVVCTATQGPAASLRMAAQDGTAAESLMASLPTPCPRASSTHQFRLYSFNFLSSLVLLIFTKVHIRSTRAFHLPIFPCACLPLLNFINQSTAPVQ
jgi:hypothetical protein